MAEGDGKSTRVSLPGGGPKITIVQSEGPKTESKEKDMLTAEQVPIHIAGGKVKKNAQYYCSACHQSFFDLQSASAHKLTRRHLINSGLPLPEEIPAVDVKPSDIMDLVEKKRVEKNVIPLSELRRKRTREED